MFYLKKFETNNSRTQYEGGGEYIEPYVSLVKEDDSSHYNKSYLCKLTLQDGSKVKLYDANGDGVLTSAMTSSYKSTLVSAKIGNACTSIDNDAFNTCSSLTSVTISNSVTSIGVNAFRLCISLISIDIPNGVTSIGRNAFYYCTGLTNVTIGNSVTSIGDYAFGDSTNLTSVTIGDSVTRIGGNAFNGCSKLTSITVNATTAPTITSDTFGDVKTNGTLTVPSGSSGYDVWMSTSNYYLGYYNWTKVEQ